MVKAVIFNSDDSEFHFAHDSKNQVTYCGKSFDEDDAYRVVPDAYPRDIEKEEDMSECPKCGKRA